MNIICTVILSGLLHTFNGLDQRESHHSGNLFRYCGCIAGKYNGALLIQPLAGHRTLLIN